MVKRQTRGNKEKKCNAKKRKDEITLGEKRKDEIVNCAARTDVNHENKREKTKKNAMRNNAI